MKGERSKKKKKHTTILSENKRSRERASICCVNYARVCVHWYINDVACKNKIPHSVQARFWCAAQDVCMRLLFDSLSPCVCVCVCVCVRYVSVFMHTSDLKSVIDKKFSSFFPKKPHRIPVFFYFIFFTLGILKTRFIPRIWEREKKSPVVWWSIKPSWFITQIIRMKNNSCVCSVYNKEKGLHSVWGISALRHRKHSSAETCFVFFLFCLVFLFFFTDEYDF